MRAGHGGGITLHCKDRAGGTVPARPLNAGSLPVGMPPNFAIRPARTPERERLYEIHRAALGPYVVEVWGWDDTRQVEMFARNFDPVSLLVIEVG